MVGGFDVIFYDLYGVVGVIVFWNFLMMIVLWVFVLVFVVGNVVVLKFVELILFIVFCFGEFVCEVGFLEGLFEVVMGFGFVVG